MQVILREPDNAERRALKTSSSAAKPNAAPAGQSRRAPTNVPRQRKPTSLGTLIFAVLIVSALAWGWLNRDVYLTAESGVGYYVGIAGALSMLALLAYPLRKYVGFLRGAGPVSFWFRLHMALGIIGPTLILYHANFGLGSANSNVALWSMLIVAGSGLVGRFFYAKIHRGLYGKRAEARELLTEATAFRSALDSDIGEALMARIEKLEKTAFESADGMFGAASKAIVTTARARRLHGIVRREIRASVKAANKNRDKESIAELRSHLVFCRRYFQRIEQAAELSFYERLFAAWHILHLPLFFLLIITAVIHVVAVHLY